MNSTIPVADLMPLLKLLVRTNRSCLAWMTALLALPTLLALLLILVMSIGPSVRHHCLLARLLAMTPFLRAGGAPRLSSTRSFPQN